MLKLRLPVAFLAIWLALVPVASLHAMGIPTQTKFETSSPQQVSGGAIYIPMASTAGDAPDWLPDRASVDIEWDTNTTVVDEEHLSLLVFADTEAHVYHFDQAGAAAAGLDLSPGRNIFIYNTAVRRIAAAVPDGANVIVETEYIDLTDAITNADMEWDLGIEFDPELVAQVSVMGHDAILDADGKVAFEFTQGDFTYNLEMILEGDRSTVDFKVTKTTAGALTTSLTATGAVERFRVKNDITIRDNTLTDFGHDQDKMRGDLTVGLNTQASGSDRLNIEAPVVLLKIPKLVLGIPVVVSIKIQFVFMAEVPATGSAQVKTHFVYDSDMGLRYNGTSVEADARVGNLTFDALTAQTGAAGAISANFGMGFPRVELGIFGQTIVPWAQTAFNIGGSYTMFPACQTADALMLGAAGLNLSFLGIKVNFGSTVFFREERKLLRAGDCPD